MTSATCWSRADSTCSHYWNQHEESKNTIEGHWIRTGDKYYQDSDGYFWYVGRSDDMLKCSGVWVSPIEIEGVLIEHPAVLEAAVIGREDHDQLLKPAACIVLKSGIAATSGLARELQEFVVSRLPASIVVGGRSDKGGSEELAALLKRRRESTGLSRRELADATGLSYPYISQLETGYRLPSSKAMQMLARALLVDPAELFGALPQEDLPDSGRAPARRSPPLKNLPAVAVPGQPGARRRAGAISRVRGGGSRSAPRLRRWRRFRHASAWRR